MPPKPRLVKRYTELPLTLFRIQPRFPVTLRNYDDQISRGRRSFDLRVHPDGLVHPLPADTRIPYTTPNGMSLRPVGEAMKSILRNFPGSPMIFRLQEGTLLPDELCVFHERTDHWSLQTTRPVPLDVLNATMTEFLKGLPPPQTVGELLEWLEDEDDHDN